MEQPAEKTYLAIDLKSFYASVECVSRGLDPLTANLVVADASRTEKTICLAVSPSLKALGIPGRPRLFEVEQQVRQVNTRRRRAAPGGRFTGSSYLTPELAADPALELDYITAAPRMAHYIRCSTDIYNIYLKYAAPQDIHVYSIDEVFIDITHYLPLFGLSPRELAMKIILDILNTTGITATAGIGTNLYLCKVAMDLWAKHVRPDKNGVRIACLDEMSYRRQLWTHRPLTDFWRVGRGYASRLEENGLYTMGDIARCSLGGPGAFHSEALLYRLFGVNAELLIDHAWGWEPCTIADIKAYRPASSSIGSGQVLQCPYPFDKARLAAWEMADQLSMELAEKHLVTDRLVLTVGYDIENLRDPARQEQYRGETTVDYYGRRIPKHAHGTTRLESCTASSRCITGAVLSLFDRVVDRGLLVRRIYLTAGRVVREEELPREMEQLDLFSGDAARLAEEAELAREKTLQRTLLDIKARYGKNAILKGTNLVPGATAVQRNRQIGGHRA